MSMFSFSFDMLNQYPIMKGKNNCEMQSYSKKDSLEEKWKGNYEIIFYFMHRVVEMGLKTASFFILTIFVMCNKNM